MEAQGKLYLALALIAYIALVYFATRWFQKSDRDTVSDKESKWLLDDFYLPKE